MAAINSLAYLVYSILTLTANNKPTTDRSLNAWRIDSDVTETWSQEPYDVTEKYAEGDCPAGETWSDCDAGCESTCETAGKPVICPRMCIPGCVCEEPGAVRGPNRKCIHPPLCPRAYEPPVTPYGEPVTLDAEWRTRPYGEQEETTSPPLAERDPEYLSFRYTERPPVQPYAEQDPDNRSRHHKEIRLPVPVNRQWRRKDTTFPPVEPDDSVWAEQDPDNTRIDPDESIWAERDPDMLRVDPDESIRADQDPDVPTGKFYSGGCPRTIACSQSCKRQGYKYGMCTGPNKTNCHCYRQM